MPMHGWNSTSVVTSYLAGWDDFHRGVNSTSAWGEGASNVAPRHGDYIRQNTRLVFAYALQAASFGKTHLRVLDWGGGLGHYYLLARTILPELSLDWVIKDVPNLCETGRCMLPDVCFTSVAEEALSCPYSLVLASSSLQYSKDWRDVATKLAAATGSLLLITRQPVCHRQKDFVVVQRSYGTAYPGWILNRAEFLLHLEQQCSMDLLREFLICPGESVHGAPEDHEQRGFLFAPRAENAHE